MEISEAAKGLRVRLVESARSTFEPWASWRLGGYLRSGRVIASRPPYEEGLFVYVVWDELPTPEKWHLRDIEREP